MLEFRYRTALVVAAAAVGGCAGHGSARTSEQAIQAVPVDSAVNYARALFHQAIGAADTLSLQSVLDSNVTISVRGEVVVRGASAVAFTLTGNRDGTGTSVRLMPSSEPELCRAGGVATGAYALRHAEDGKLLGQDNGSYAMHLKVSGYGARVDDITLDRAPSEARRAITKPC